MIDDQSSQKPNLESFLEPFLEPFLAPFKDPEVTDVCAGQQGIFADRGSGLRKTPLAVPSETVLRDWVIQQLSLQGRSWDARQPFADLVVTVHLSSHEGTPARSQKLRVHAIFPPLCPEGIQVSLRRITGRTGEQQVSGCRWTGPSADAYALLKEATLKRETILICGATGSGKTTLLRDLLSEIPTHERLVALEDTPELAPDHPQFIRLLSRPASADGIGEVTLRTLFRQTLRMRPDRILIGECRGPEVLEWLQALNSGHAGALATIHAPSARDALRRAELLALLAGVPGLGASLIRDLLASGVQWVVLVEKTPTGRMLSEVARIRGREGDTILLEPVINRGREDLNGRPETFPRSGISIKKTPPG